MELKKFIASHVRNINADPGRGYGDAEREVLNLEAFRTARDEICTWPGYSPTPLVNLPGLAGALGLGDLYQKDEGKRFGLKSFKALGGAYAVLRLLQQILDQEFGLPETSSAELLSGRHRNMTAQVTVAAATDGNHGRSVAWGAEMFGCKAKIYLHGLVGKSREREIAKYGADIIRVDGTYDDSVRQCAIDADANGWHLVADTTAGGGREDLPRLVMQGYTIMVQEALDQMPGGTPPTHIFVPGGVGGIAAAVAGHVSETLAARRPRIVVVEPNKADCIFRSVSVDRLMAVDGELDTFMACLSAGEVSPLAWPIIRYQVDDVLSIPDKAAVETMRLLALGTGGDVPVVAGESGVAAMAGIIAASLDDGLRHALELAETSCVVAIGSEGATDAEVYQRVVGRAAEQVEAA